MHPRYLEAHTDRGRIKGGLGRQRTDLLTPQAEITAPVENVRGSRVLGLAPVSARAVAEGQL
jgi:hypothetical protein